MDPSMISLIASIVSILFLASLISICACCGRPKRRSHSDPYMPAGDKKVQSANDAGESTDAKAMESPKSPTTTTLLVKKETKTPVDQTLAPATAIQMTVIAPDPNAKKTTMPTAMSKTSEWKRRKASESIAEANDPAYQTFGRDLEDPFLSSQSVHPSTHEGGKSKSRKRKKHREQGEKYNAPKETTLPMDDASVDSITVKP